MTTTIVLFFLITINRVVGKALLVDDGVFLFVFERERERDTTVTVHSCLSVAGYGYKLCGCLMEEDGNHAGHDAKCCTMTATAVQSQQFCGRQWHGDIPFGHHSFLNISVPASWWVGFQPG